MKSVKSYKKSNSCASQNPSRIWNPAKSSPNRCKILFDRIGCKAAVLLDCLLSTESRHIQSPQGVGEIFLCPCLINSPTRFACRGIKFCNSCRKIGKIIWLGKNIKQYLSIRSVFDSQIWPVHNFLSFLSYLQINFNGQACLYL